MKAEFIRCPHCGLLHPTTARSCPATGASLHQAPPDSTDAGRGPDSQSVARLVVQTAEGERTFYLQPTNSLGRHPNNSIQILDKIVSKEHCRIEIEGERFILRDLGSLNGTFVNGERVHGASPLNHGDMVTLGATRAFFYEASASQSPSEPEVDTAAERFLAHLAFDKPLYRPGETLFARAAVLDAYHRAPLGRAVTLAFEVRSPRGEIVVNRAGQVMAGVAPFSWAIPADLAVGDYTLLCLFPADGFPPAEMPFSISDHRAPRLNLELELTRKAYGPGDEVVAALSAARVEGGVPAGARVTAIATVDGAEVHRSERTLDAAGSAAVRFRLPAAIEEGGGTLVMIVADGGVEETAAKAIPIVVSRVSLSLYPEGGDLIMGLGTRLYLQARTSKGKPADVAGRIIDGTGAVLARFRTEHEGRSRVELAPARAGRAYIAVLEEPAGMSELFPLPEVVKEGFTLSSLDDETSPEEAVRLRVASTSATWARVVLYAREREVAAVRVDLVAGEPKEVALTPPGNIDGVLRAAVYDASGVPRAERLVFRRPRRSLQVSIEAAPAQAGLRERASVRIRTTNAEGQPIPSMLMVSVVDDAVLERIERRERLPRLPAQALLGAEVRDLSDPEAYLSGGAAAARRLDLLLGVQGWRRFAFYDVSRFIAEHGDQADRALARRRPVAPALAMIMPGAPRGVVVGAQATHNQMPAVMMAPAAPAIEALAPTAPRAPLAPLTPALRTPSRPEGLSPVLLLAKPRTVPPRPALAPQARRALPTPRPVALVIAREYAYRAPVFDGARVSYPETLYWNAALPVREAGEATVAFDLCDSVTTFRIRADAFGADGALGQGEATIEARSPFYLEPKLPVEVSAGDVIDLPVVLVNDTAEGLGARIWASVTGSLMAGQLPHVLQIAAGGRERTLVPVAVGPGQGVFTVTLSASAQTHSDEVRRDLSVAPSGFPVEIYAAGRLEPGERALCQVEVPEAIEASSLSAEVILSPSPPAALAAALAALLREPAGGLEQAIAVAYPSVMILRYLASHAGADVALERRAAALTESGYRRLVDFECKEGGYGWFGAEPAHEALTAYALMAFTDMAAVHPVDGEMLARTRAKLLSRRDGRGGFALRSHAVDVLGGAPQDITDAYITWALGQAGVPEIASEIAHVRGLALGSEDSYLLALAANVLLDAGDPMASTVLDKLTGKQDADGAVRGAATSITRSGGRNLVIETTSLAILAWLKADRIELGARATRWLLGQCQGGRFGATQATILALKALLAHDAHEARPRAAGTVRVHVDGQPAGEVSFTADHEGLIALPSFARALSSTRAEDPRQVELDLEGGAAMPYALRVRYQTTLPRAEGGCKVALTTSLISEEVLEGDVIVLQIDLVNTTDEHLPMVVAVIGVPGGLEPRVEQLQELVADGRIDAWETRGREVVIYRRSMAPGERAALGISLLGAVPGTYLGPASRAYLYYTDDKKTWAAPLRVRVVAGR